MFYGVLFMRVSIQMDSSHVCSVAAAMDSDSTDVVVNPLSVLPVSSSSSLNSGWSALLQRSTLTTTQPSVSVSSPHATQSSAPRIAHQFTP